MCEIFIDILKYVRVGLYVSEYIYKIKAGYNRCSYLTYLKLYMKAQLISSPICQIDTNLLFSINYCMHEYSSFWGDLMIKATADRNPELIKILSPTLTECACNF